MFGLLFNPTYRRIRGIIGDALGKEAKGLLSQVKRLWEDLVGSVDVMILESMGELVHDSAIKGWPKRDYWEDKDGIGHYGVSIPFDDLQRFIEFRAVQLGPSMVQQMRDPWFTLSQAGMTGKLQADIIATLVKYRFSDTLNGGIGSIVGEFTPTRYVLVAIGLEAYKPLAGTPKLAKLGEMHTNDKNDPLTTKRVFEKKTKYERGEYDLQALSKALPAGKFM